jgi:hypothetical protein
MNPAMPFKEMLSYIVEGMSPQIKATIMHKENPNILKLQENARNIEEGLKKAGKLETTSTDDVKARIVSNEENVRLLSEKMDKLFDKFDETNNNIHEFRRESRRPNRDRGYDKFGRRIVDRYRNNSRDHFVNVSRDSSRNKYRNLPRDDSRDRSRPYYSNKERDDNSGRREPRL